MTAKPAHDGRESTFETRFDPADERPSDALVRAVAVVKNVEPTRLTPLATVVDPEALDSVVGVDRSAATVRFPYEGYRVAVSTDGTIELFADD